jgi:hypothetical protein
LGSFSPALLVPPNVNVVAFPATANVLSGLTVPALSVGAGTVILAAAALPAAAVAVSVAVCALAAASGAVYVVVVPLVADIDPTPDRLHVTAWLAVNACVCRACTETLPDGVIVTCTGTVTTAAAALPEDAVAVTVAVCALPVAAGAVYVVVVPLVADIDPTPDRLHVTAWLAVNACVCRACTETLPDGVIVTGANGIVTVASALFPAAAVAVTVAVCWLAVAAGAVYVVVVPVVAEIAPTPNRLHVTDWLAVNTCVCSACTETLPDGVIVTCAAGIVIVI